MTVWVIIPRDSGFISHGPLDSKDALSHIPDNAEIYQTANNYQDRVDELSDQS